MFRVLTPIIRSYLQKCNKLSKSRLVEKLLNSIHNGRSHVYKITLLCKYLRKIQCNGERTAEERLFLVDVCLLLMCVYC